MPLAMALANRSSPLVVGLAALLFLAAALADDPSDALGRLVRPLVTPVGLAALGFLGWCAVSVAWSPFPAASGRSAGEFLPTLAAAYILARLAPGRLPPFAAPLAAAAIVLASLWIVVGLAAGLPVQRALGMRVADFVFNRPALTLLLVAGPLALVLARRGRRLAGAAVLAFGAAGILRSVSGAAAMGLIAGTAMVLAARLLPARLGSGLAGLGLGCAVALAPIEGDLLRRVMPEAAHERLVQSSSRARVAIARSFGAAVAADPWRGAGYGVSGRFAETPVAQRVEPEMRDMLAVGHPHNSFLQVWAELGIVGAGLAMAVLLLTLRALAAWQATERAAALGLTAAAAAVAFVEHGAWQAWWTAGLGAAISWLREAARPQPLSDRRDSP
ncbi:O-antigen ligase family protein [Methylobacterium nigriterrae]|uniref:O-antigen ligase family protein n=1 Tax=Methylobacterium nigriterrae TaxID=3127512 RepID=UPI003013E8DE